MKRLIQYCTIFLLMLLLCYCGTARRGEPVFAPVPLADQEIARGEVVYMNYCHKCHPGGEAGLGPAINDKPLPGFMIKLQVRNGLGVMPAFKEEVIPDEELDDMVAYLKALRKAKEEE
ncbi:c-type cytochrome [Pontibacter diazotrophicus]|nr:cytochrome c [Pontibacter diazotrophicus]